LNFEPAGRRHGAIAPLGFVVSIRALFLPPALQATTPRVSSTALLREHGTRFKPIVTNEESMKVLVAVKRVIDYNVKVRVKAG